jgi:hypothetical protein
MAFIIQTEELHTDTGEIATLYAQSVGKAAVKWTPDRDKARRYRHYDTAAKAAAGIASLSSRATAAPVAES